MNEKDLHIIGAGGHASVVAEIAQLAGFRIVGIYDDDPTRCNAVVLLHGVAGRCMDVPDASLVFVAIGDNTARLVQLTATAEKGAHHPVLIHPSAVVSAHATLGTGTVIMASAVVNPGAAIGKGCIINTGATVDHHCQLGDGVHIAPGVHLAGGVRIGTGTIIGIGSCVIPGITIGEFVVVGAGSVVISDILDRAKVYGNPARVRTC